jgi:hypothetical protein
VMSRAAMATTRVKSMMPASLMPSPTPSPTPPPEPAPMMPAGQPGSYSSGNY